MNISAIETKHRNSASEGRQAARPFTFPQFYNFYCNIEACNRNTCQLSNENFKSFAIFQSHVNKEDFETCIPVSHSGGPSLES